MLQSTTPGTLLDRLSSWILEVKSYAKCDNFMSILAKLLQKKEESPVETGQIPPTLLRTVSRSGGEGSKRTLYLLIGGVSLALVLVGYFLVAYYQQSRSTLAPAASPLPSPARAPAVAAAPPVQQVASSARSPLPVAVKKTEEKQVEKKVAAVEHQAPSPPARVAAARPVAPPAATRRSGKTLVASPSATPRKSASGDRLTQDAYLAAARSAEARRDYLQALRQYLKAQEQDPGNYRIMNNIASTFLQLGLPDEALSFANKALSRKGDYVSALVNAGIAHGKLGDGAASRAMLGKAVRIDPSNSQALFNLALSQERAEQKEDAYRSYHRLAEGGDSQGYLGMARLEERRGNKSEALRIYRDILALPDGSAADRESARRRISQLE